MLDKRIELLEDECIKSHEQVLRIMQMRINEMQRLLDNLNGGLFSQSPEKEKMILRATCNNIYSTVQEFNRIPSKIQFNWDNEIRNMMVTSGAIIELRNIDCQNKLEEAKNNLSIVRWIVKYSDEGCPWHQWSKIHFIRKGEDRTLCGKICNTNSDVMGIDLCEDSELNHLVNCPTCTSIEC